MRYTVTVTSLATITTEYNLNFLKLFNSEYSVKVANNILSEIKSLSNFPHSYPLYKRINKNIYRKFLINNIFHVIFTISNNKVFVLYTTDARKEADEYYSFLN